MTLRVIGAGLGRTGTLSLKYALERLLEGPCYHMVEIFANPEHIGPWHRAVRGESPDWAEFLGGCVGALDEPASLFWPELMEVFPDALVLLSLRDPDEWWASADATSFRVLRGPPPEQPPFMSDWHAMVMDMMRLHFPGALDDRDAAIDEFNRHNERVRQRVPAERLLEWTVGDGWAPLCAALDMPLRDDPFPHVNTRAEWSARGDANTES